MTMCIFSNTFFTSVVWRSFDAKACDLYWFVCDQITLKISVPYQFGDVSFRHTEISCFYDHLECRKTITS